MLPSRFLFRFSVPCFRASRSGRTNAAPASGTGSLDSRTWRQRVFRRPRGLDAAGWHSPCMFKASRRLPGAGSTASATAIPSSSGLTRATCTTCTGPRDSATGSSHCRLAAAAGGPAARAVDADPAGARQSRRDRRRPAASPQRETPRRLPARRPSAGRVADRLRSCRASPPGIHLRGDRPRAGADALGRGSLPYREDPSLWATLELVEPIRK